MPLPQTSPEADAAVRRSRDAAKRALAAWAWECLNLRRAGLDRPSVRGLEPRAPRAPRRKAA